jgi:hypothetical protein
VVFGRLSWESGLGLRAPLPGKKGLPATTSATYFTRTMIRSCNIFTAARWVWRCDSTRVCIVSHFL